MVIALSYNFGTSSNSMKYVRNRNILYFPGMEPWKGQLNRRKIELLENSWAGIFREHIVPRLPVEKLASHFSDDMGRPSKELVTVMGSALLQQMFDLTDAETRDQLAFNQQWHYALDTFNLNEQVISLKTLWTVRNMLVEDGLDQEVFKEATDGLAKTFDVDIHLQRIDSVHVHSNMARLGRVRLMARVITKFLKNLSRRHRKVFELEISGEMRDRYMREKRSGYFGNVKPSESSASWRMKDIASDLYGLIQRFSSDAQVKGMYSYRLMERLFSEQCCVEEGEVVLIPAKEVSPDSLQNPSDADATYDGYKGEGYQVQVMETYTRSEIPGDGGASDPPAGG